MQLPISFTVFLLGLGACSSEVGTSRVQQEALYGQDSRQEVYAASNEIWRSIAQRSIASQLNIASWNLCQGPSLSIQPDAPTMAQVHSLCDDVRFAEQPAVSRCSATLIDRDLIVTASHCIVDDEECANSVFGFGLHYQAENELRPLSADNFYTCAKVVARIPGYDVVIVQTDRPVDDYWLPVALAPTQPLLDEPLAVIGFPSGMPMKVSDQCSVRKESDSIDRFNMDCDVFRGNSGSGVFNALGELTGIFTRLFGDYRPRGDEGCNEPMVLTQDGHFVDSGSTSQHFAEAQNPSLVVSTLCAQGWPSPALCGNDTVCGDGICSEDEQDTCSADCLGDVCGDGICAPEELATCVSDCEHFGCFKDEPGPPDAGVVSRPDAGEPTPETPTGCGCSQGGAPQPSSLVFLLGFLFLGLRFLRPKRHRA